MVEHNRIVDTATLSVANLSATEALHVYNGLDSCVTLEILGVIEKNLDNMSTGVYGFSEELQAPVLDMMLRGIKVDKFRKSLATGDLEADKKVLEHILDRLTVEGLGYGEPLNWRSGPQLRDLFYTTLRVPPILGFGKSAGKVTLDRKALEKIMEADEDWPRFFAKLVLALRDCDKTIQALRAGVDPDGRMRCSFSIGGTECVSEDTLIQTSSGIRTMGDVCDSARLPGVFNGTEFVTPDSFIKFADAEGLCLTTTHGYQIKCSLKHPLWIKDRGWSQAQNIEIGDEAELSLGLPLRGGYSTFRHQKMNFSITEDFCEFIGMWLADGSLDCSPESGHYRARLSSTDKEVRNRFLSLAYKCFGVVGCDYEKECHFSSKEICQDLLRDTLKLPANEGLGTATRKVIPKQLMQAYPNLLRALLRGLSLDSHVTDKGLNFGTQSVQLREQVQQILLSLGIVSTKLSCGKSIKLVIPWGYCYRFLGLIGLTSDKKSQQLWDLLRTRGQWHEPLVPHSKVFLTIKSKEPWRGTVFDFRMPANKPPQYVANGFTVHNSGRLSSSKSVFRTGMNLQNVHDKVRQIFVSDSGKKLAYVDLQQAESWAVGMLVWEAFGDSAYLDSIISGDLHTTVSKMVWPEVAWTGDLKLDKKLADEKNFYREFSRRDIAKRLGHGSNYGGRATSLAKILKIDAQVTKDFQNRYFSAFPGIKRWHYKQMGDLQTCGNLVTPLGRRRWFFGRRNDDATIREAIAYCPQSMVADILNKGMLKVYQESAALGLPIELLCQIHDAILIQVPESPPEEHRFLLTKVLEWIKVPVSIEFRETRRTFVIPADCKTGWNWRSWGDGSLDRRGVPTHFNPDGLRDFDPHGAIDDPRTRFDDQEAHFLDRSIR